MNLNSKKNKEYTFEEKKKINSKINKLRKIGNKEDFIKIGKLILSSIKKNNITNKKNGIWFDLTLVDDITIGKIDRLLTTLLNNYEEQLIDSDTIDRTYIPYYIDPNTIKSRIGPKFSKKEKNLINRFRNESEIEIETESDNNKSELNLVNN